MKRNLLGDLLVARRALTSEQLRLALAQHRRWGRPLGQTVVALGYCGASDVLAALSQQTGLPAVDLDAEPLGMPQAELLPRALVERLRVVPLRRCGPGHQILVVAVPAPGALSTVDALRRHTGLRISTLIAADDALARGIQRLFACDDAFAWPGGPLRPLQEQMFEVDWADQSLSGA